MAQVHSGGTDARRSAMDWKSLKMEEQRRACWAHGEEVEEDNAEAALFCQTDREEGEVGCERGEGPLEQVSRSFSFPMRKIGEVTL